MESSFSADDGSDQSKIWLLGLSMWEVEFPLLDPECVTSARAARKLGLTLRELRVLEGGDRLPISMFSSSLVQSSSSSSSSNESRPKSFVAREKLGVEDGAASSISIVLVRTGVRSDRSCEDRDRAPLTGVDISSSSSTILLFPSRKVPLFNIS
jgi:hypothetical protein